MVDKELLQRVTALEWKFDELITFIRQTMGNDLAEEFEEVCDNLDDSSKDIGLLYYDDKVGEDIFND